MYLRLVFARRRDTRNRIRRFLLLVKSPVHHQHPGDWECGKMCLNVNTPISKACKIVSPPGPVLFILDGVGYTDHNTTMFCSQMRNGTKAFRLPVVLKHDLVEDG
ncbi:Uncharacterized protein Adt_00952 [Abeliophyllum distichum]|uniref:Uncharacterized protein n=1 Tax=Abeliophyllum distichum TaxID=126358 RepID=A0ABD1VRJ2_9LAMI